MKKLFSYYFLLNCSLFSMNPELDKQKSQTVTLKFTPSVSQKEIVVDSPFPLCTISKEEISTIKIIPECTFSVLTENESAVIGSLHPCFGLIIVDPIVNKTFVAHYNHMTPLTSLYHSIEAYGFLKESLEVIIYSTKHFQERYQKIQKNSYKRMEIFFTQNSMSVSYKLFDEKNVRACQLEEYATMFRFLKVKHCKDSIEMGFLPPLLEILPIFLSKNIDFKNSSDYAEAFIGFGIILHKIRNTLISDAFELTEHDVLNFTNDPQKFFPKKMMVSPRWQEYREIGRAHV